jgi:replicative DNA helicase
VERSSPKAVEAERALLGGLLLSPGRLPEVTERVSAEDFYRPEHQALFTLLVQMQGRGETIDTVTVPERIAREGLHERYGGVGYVMQLPDQVPSTANLPHYAGVVREKALLRKLIGVTMGKKRAV